MLKENPVQRFNDIKGNRKLGRGLAEVSNVFQSKKFPAFSPKENVILNNIFITGITNNLTRPFFTSYLTIELAKLRHKILLLDAECLDYTPTSLLTNLETKPLTASFYHSLFPNKQNGFLTQQVFFDPDYSFNLISLKFKDKSFSNWKKFNEYFHPQKNNPEFLKTTELIIISSCHDWLLKELNENNFFTPLENIIVLTAITRDEIISTYTLIKNIFNKFSDQKIGLVIYGTEKEETAHLAYQKIQETVNKHLNKSIYYFGSIPHTDEIYETLMAHKPAILNKESSNLYYPISACAQRIMKTIRVSD
ncbi:MAG: hypothetical protein AB1498_00680 [bacterium]